MSTYTQIIYQIVFGTKYRRHVLCKENRDELFRYMTGILQSKNCHVFRINGIEDHLHILTHLHPSISLSNLVKDIKLASSCYIREKNLFPEFQGWQEGYGAFTYSVREKDRLIEYVKNQEEHHKTRSYKDEYTKMLKENDIDFDEKYLL
jgi:putative transposase